MSQEGENRSPNFVNTWFNPRFFGDIRVVFFLVLCVVFCCLSPSCVPNVDSISGFSINDLPLG